MQAHLFINAQEFLQNWLSHRRLTRKVIEAFPEKELFEFSIGGMRPFADMVKELIAIAVPGLTGIVSNTIEVYNHNLPLDTKSELLNRWDEDTPQIEALFNQISEDRLPEVFNLFGEYEFPIAYNLIYFLENEIHHRGQGYVYLRALGIEPPFFWDR